MVASKTLLFLAGFSSHRSVRLARENRAAENRALRASLDEDARSFRETMAKRSRRPTVCFGTIEGGERYLVEVDDIVGSFGWLTAGTGGGKSFLALGAIVMPLVRLMTDGTSAPAVIVVDLKGETADLTLRVAAAHAATLSPERRRAFLGRLITIQPFTGPYLPELQLLARDPSVPVMVQAQAGADTFTSTVQAGLRHRQSDASDKLLATLIENDLTFLGAPAFLADARAFRRLAETSSIPEVRLYAQTRLDRQSSATADGLASHISTFLRTEAIRACLAGPGMLDLRRCYEPGSLTVINLGLPPIGSESAAAMLGKLLMTRLTWAGFDPTRVVRAPTILVCDEIQELINATTIRHIERIVTTGRSQRIGLWAVHQGAQQMPAELQAVLGNNVRFRIMGAQSEGEARAAAEWLPRHGGTPKPRAHGTSPNDRSGVLSDAEALRHEIAALTRMPPRHFLVGDRRAPFQSRVVRAQDIAPPPWSAIAPGIRDAVLRGAVGEERTALIARADELEARAVASIDVAPPAARSRRGVREAHSSFPDVVGRRRNRGSGEVL